MAATKSPIHQYIISKVRDMRIAKGISQRELSLYLDLTESFVGKVETPKSNHAYNIDHLNELAKILECSPKEFWPEKALLLDNS